MSVDGGEGDGEGGKLEDAIDECTEGLRKERIDIWLAG